MRQTIARSFNHRAMLFVSSKSQSKKRKGKKAESLARSPKQLNPETKIDGELHFLGKIPLDFRKKTSELHKEYVCVRQASPTLWGGCNFTIKKKHAPFQGEGENRRSS